MAIGNQMGMVSTKGMTSSDPDTLSIRVESQRRVPELYWDHRSYGCDLTMHTNNAY
jgi:hypothetical protein